MCLVIAIFLMVFGFEFYDTNFSIALFSFVVGGVMFIIFLYRISTYKQRKQKAITRRNKNGYTTSD